jgi:hypothetical protein
MSRQRMNIKVLIFLVLVMSGLVSAGAVGEAPANNDAVPLIQFENLPLPEVIRNLAQQARLNILLDPRVTQPPLSLTKVSVRWEGVTAKEALLAILDNYGLVLVE